MFSYMVGGWVQQNAYVIKNITENFQIDKGQRISKPIFLAYNSCKKNIFLPHTIRPLKWMVIRSYSIKWMTYLFDLIHLRLS